MSFTNEQIRIALETWERNMRLNFTCTHPQHDERNFGLWHTWRDEKGRHCAQRCPASVEAENLDREASREARKESSKSWLD